MRSATIILALASLVAGLDACDSTVTARGSGGAGGGGGTISPLVPACPATPASVGSPCSEIVRCEYGDDVDFSCNIVMLCEVSGVWSMQQDGQGGSCPSSPDPCAGTPTGSCDPLGIECEIDLGLCTCADVLVAPGQVTDQLWRCADPDPACPPWPNRPIIGSPCSVPDLLCEYKPCTNHLAFRCDPDGYWSDAFGGPCVQCGASMGLQAAALRLECRQNDETPDHRAALALWAGQTEETPDCRAICVLGWVKTTKRRIVGRISVLGRAKTTKRPTIRRISVLHAVRPSTLETTRCGSVLRGSGPRLARRQFTRRRTIRRSFVLDGRRPYTQRSPTGTP